MISAPTDSLIQERFRTDDVILGEGDLDAAIEALLFAATESPTVSHLAEALQVDEQDIIAAMSRMESQPSRGWILQRHGETVRLTTAPRFAEHVRRFLGLERQTRLSPAALETLAIVAYRQPVARAEIELVRGVDCTGVLATLLNRNLIENSVPVEATVRAHLYVTTPEFLMHFGLSSLDQLPDLGLVHGEDAHDHLTTMMAGADAIDSGAPISD
jgi:segregation and condensation protein B